MSAFVDTTAITSLYSFDPAVKNLYTVEISNEDTSGNDMKDAITYHAFSVNLPSDTLKLERNSVTKNFTLTENGSYSFADTLTINWREDANWNVRKFHQEWLDLFYDRTTDTYRSVDWTNSTTGKKKVDERYKKFTITLPNGSKAVCCDVIPTQQWNLDLAWGNSPSIVTYNIVYNVGFWYWEEKK
jgi:hypothetical protein